MVKVALLLPVLIASIRSHDDVANMDEIHSTVTEKQAVHEQPQPAENEPDECAVVEGAVRRDSAWRRTKKCKCAKGEMLQCPQMDCEQTGRYFRPADVKELGCQCRQDCMTECGEVVEGAVWRRSAWRRSETKCKCPKNQMIAGRPECTENAASPRHFAKGPLRDLGCSCQPDPNADTGESSGAEPAPPASEPQPPRSPRDEEQKTPGQGDGEDTADDKDGKEEDQTGERDTKKPNGAASRVAGGLAATAWVMAVMASSLTARPTL